MPAQQLPLNLVPLDPFSLRYFVPHSGVSDAQAALERCLVRLAAEDSTLSFVFIYGASGLGKTHLLQGLRTAALEQGGSEERLGIFDWSGTAVEKMAEQTGQFVATYEALRSAGGMLLVAGNSLPCDLTTDPHLLSRLVTAELIEVLPPRDEELSPVIHSLMERRNLRLSAKAVEYLVNRLPRTPLSFDVIFARINELSAAEISPANLRVIRDAVRERS